MPEEQPPPSLGTLQDEWEKYASKVYPQGMTDDQRKQVHQAFFAGAVVIAAHLRVISFRGNDSDEKDAALLESLCNEAFHVMDHVAECARARN